MSKIACKLFNSDLSLPVINETNDSNDSELTIPKRYMETDSIQHAVIPSNANSQDGIDHFYNFTNRENV